MPDIFDKTQNRTSAQKAVPESIRQNEHRNMHTTRSGNNGKMGIFTAICEYPTGINFVNQEQDEEIIVFLRKHFITNLGWIIASVIALFIPFLIGFITNATSVEFVTIPTGIITALLIFYYLIIIGYMYTSFLSWFFNIGIVTQKRMIDIDYNNILHKNITSVHLSEVVDLEFVQRGFLQSLFNYGDILVQTQGVKPNFEFLGSPEPAHVIDIIHDVMTQTKNDNK